jgi:hypothetical protein
MPDETVMDGIEETNVGRMTVCRRVLRLLFFACEAGTLGAWIIFAALQNLAPSVVRWYPHGWNPAFDSFLSLGTIFSFALLPASLCIWRSDRDLAHVGFGTFVIVMLLQPFSVAL